jgi:hypothetical protein
MEFATYMSQHDSHKQGGDLRYWTDFVNIFFSQSGVMRHSLWIVDEKTTKQFEIGYAALPRYFYTHYEGGVKNMQLVIEQWKEQEIPGHGYLITSGKSSFVYWYENGSQVSLTFHSCFPKYIANTS